MTATQDPRDPYLVESGHSMRCLLAVAVTEAVKLALVDSVLPPQDEAHPYGVWTREEKAEFRHDIHKIPAEAMAGMDAMALAQNVCCRLLGRGAWFVGGIYAGNATDREVFEATVERPDYSAVDELAFDMGLAPAEDDD